MTNLIGARIKALREERKLSQEELARMFGFKDRQTVSAIETGERRVSAEELLLAVERLGVSLDYFTDPFQLAGEGKFSWRRDPRRLGGPGSEPDIPCLTLGSKAHLGHDQSIPRRGRASYVGCSPVARCCCR